MVQGGSEDEEKACSPAPRNVNSLLAWAILGDWHKLSGARAHSAHTGKYDAPTVGPLSARMREPRPVHMLASYSPSNIHTTTFS